MTERFHSLYIENIGDNQISGCKKQQMCSVLQVLHLRFLLSKPRYIKRQVMTGNLNLGIFKNVQTLNPWVWIRLPTSKRKSKRRKEPKTEFSGVLIE